MWRRRGDLGACVRGVYGLRRGEHMAGDGRGGVGRGGAGRRVVEEIREDKGEGGGLYGGGERSGESEQENE